MLIHEHSGGIARTVNVICDNALITGFAVGKRPIDREVVLEVVRDFDLKMSASAAYPSRAGEHSSATVPPAAESGDIVGEPVSETGGEPQRFSLLKIR